MHTPWGASQTSEKLGDGVVQVTTASHGGIHLNPARNAKVHPAWRDKGGWYEEDCERSIVAITFPDLFTSGQVAAAHRTAKNWRPDEYEQVLGVTLQAEESYERREQIFRAETVDKLVATAAWGYRNNRAGRVDVPEGMVGVVARRGGHGGGPGAEERWFLVPEDEYRAGRFIVDEQRHAEWPETPGPDVAAEAELVNAQRAAAAEAEARARAAGEQDTTKIIAAGAHAAGLVWSAAQNTAQPHPSTAREPLFLLTGEDYEALGFVVLEEGRYLGHDTTGRRLFDRKDQSGAEDAAKKLGWKFVTSTWYGVRAYRTEEDVRVADSVAKMVPPPVTVAAPDADNVTMWRAPAVESEPDPWGPVLNEILAAPAR